MSIDIPAPDVGEGVTHLIVAEWLKRPGDAVTEGELIVEVMTDKANFEVHAPASGVLKEICAEADEEVSVGAPLGRIEAGA
ncbi:MAG: lipoyl domain-containing protein [Oceanicaulis sp.]